MVQGRPRPQRARGRSRRLLLFHVGGEVDERTAQRANFRPRGETLLGLPELQDRLHSSKLTWKLRGAPFKTTVLYKGLSMSFHVNLGEGRRTVIGSAAAKSYEPPSGHRKDSATNGSRMFLCW